jgi:hypothetical protein
MMRIRLILVMTFLLFAFTAFAADDSRDAVPRFDIKSYQVEGNTLIEADKLESILAPFTGSGRDFGAVQEALEALENAYRKRGFSTVLVTLPEQELESGVVRLKVNENRLGKINIERPLHNHLNLPFSSLPQNEGLATINPWIPPKFLGGMIRQKKTSKKFEKNYNKYTIFLDK